VLSFFIRLPWPQCFLPLTAHPHVCITAKRENIPHREKRRFLEHFKVKNVLTGALPRTPPGEMISLEFPHIAWQNLLSPLNAGGGVTKSNCLKASTLK
jgi:hypothetical protein